MLKIKLITTKTTTTVAEMCECDVAENGHNDRFVHPIFYYGEEKNGTILNDKNKNKLQQVKMCHFFVCLCCCCFAHCSFRYRSIYRRVYQFVESILKDCNRVHQLRANNNNNIM